MRTILGVMTILIGIILGIVLKSDLIGFGLILIGCNIAMKADTVWPYLLVSGLIIAFAGFTAVFYPPSDIPIKGSFMIGYGLTLFIGGLIYTIREQEDTI